MHIIHVMLFKLKVLIDSPFTHDMYLSMPDNTLALPWGVVSSGHHWA